MSLHPFILFLAGIIVGAPLGAWLKGLQDKAKLEDTGSLQIGNQVLRRDRESERKTDRYQRVDEFGRGW